jgi:hypothetical protein
MGCGLSKAHANPDVLVSHGSAHLTVHGRRLSIKLPAVAEHLDTARADIRRPILHATMSGATKC